MANVIRAEVGKPPVLSGINGYVFQERQKKEIYQRFVRAQSAKREADRLNPQRLAEKFEVPYQKIRHIDQGWYRKEPNTRLILECLAEFRRLRRIYLLNSVEQMCREHNVVRSVILRIVDEQGERYE